MKKLLLVALALLVSTASFAQFRTAPREVAPQMATKTLDYGQAVDFTVTTLDNQTIHLQDWLDSGYYVLLDISAVWCTWCWRLHNSHALETLYQNYGPNGTDEMRVLWVEGDPSTDNSTIYGGGNSLGNWTTGVSYPIATSETIATQYNLQGYPTVLLICPTGYTQDAYDVCGPYYNSANQTFNGPSCAAAIYGLLNTCPEAGAAPIAEIEGLAYAVVNNPTTFHAAYVSVDSVTSVSWSIPGATPSTGTGDNITVTFPSAGNYTVTLEVTNTTGSTTETLNVTAIEWNWGNTMSYDLDGAYASSVGGVNPMIWGAKYPAAFMSGRNYLDNVQVYSEYDGNFTLMVYQTNPGVDATSNDLIYQYTYPITGSGYNTLLPLDRVQLDNNKDLWIVFSCSDISYPAAGAAFTGDPNGSLVYLNGQWMPIYEAAASLNYTWMIKTTTSATAPAMHIAINGPALSTSGSNVTFTAAGPSSASYSWNFDGGDPATATGMSASTTFATAGNHTVTLTATLDGETATATHTINIINCETQNVPWSCGFESSDNLDCWKFLDQDGDGYGWDVSAWSGNSNYVHTGSGVVGSASYINGVGALSPDNWMITPKLSIPANGATLSYWIGPVDPDYYQEYYSVLVSTTGNNPADFTNTVHAGTVDQASWTKKSYSLAGFAGQEIYIAFRHHNINDMYWMLIDDIAVTAGNTASISEVENANVVLYPNPVTNILNIEAQDIQEVSVMDVNGRTVMTLQNTNRIDMSNLANGVYFVRVITAEGVSIQKIAKK